MKVTFQYKAGNEHGSDDYRFSKKEETQEKFLSLKELIEVQFQGCDDTEVIDEPDFFGIMDNTNGDWAKVFIA
jgi:hypothetical protein